MVRFIIKPKSFSSPTFIFVMKIFMTFSMNIQKGRLYKRNKTSSKAFPMLA